MIPNIIHFVWPEKSFKGEPFHMVHRLAIESAIAVNKPDVVLFHCGEHPEGPEWVKIKSKVEIVPTVFPSEIFGRRICHPAHQSDIVRLRALRNIGGIYLDSDTICVRPFDRTPTEGSNCIIGQESKDWLSNAILLAGRESAFIDLWLEAYRSFKGRRWGYHACAIPAQLNTIFPGLCTILPEEAFYSVTHGLLDVLFVHDLPNHDAYAYHLYSSHSWKPILRRLTRESIMEHDTTYNRLARQYF